MPSSRQASGVDDGAVAGTVVGQQLLDFDPVASIEGDRSAKEAGRGCGRLIIENFGVGESAVVVDCDVHELPACNLRSSGR